MSDTATLTRSLFAGLQPQAPDPLLSLIALYRNDPAPHKIDLGVGVYRTETGETPVFRAVKAAEAKLLAEQPTKAYLGPEGDLRYLEVLAPVVFGAGPAGADFFAVQTPGGTGALRVAADLANAGRPGARVWLGTPSWPIHASIFARAGLTIETYRHFDPATQTLLFDELLSVLDRATPGDLVLLHGCCHNPTGADYSLEQWAEIADKLAARGLVPLLDLAYQGLGQGLEQDAAGVRLVLEKVDQAMVAYSLDKNFGLYRERTGALFVRARGELDTVRSNILLLARCAWSMPPDHGAAVARLVLESPDLTADWKAELETMRLRLRSVRELLAAEVPRLAALTDQNGLFAQLPLTPDQVAQLRSDNAIYMAGSGRINLAGLTTATIPTFAQALNACLDGDA